MPDQHQPLLPAAQATKEAMLKGIFLLACGIKF